MTAAVGEQDSLTTSMRELRHMELQRTRDARELADLARLEAEREHAAAQAELLAEQRRIVDVELLEAEQRRAEANRLALEERRLEIEASTRVELQQIELERARVDAELAQARTLQPRASRSWLLVTVFAAVLGLQALLYTEHRAAAAGRDRAAAQLGELSQGLDELSVSIASRAQLKSEPPSTAAATTESAKAAPAKRPKARPRQRARSRKPSADKRRAQPHEGRVVLDCDPGSRSAQARRPHVIPPETCAPAARLSLGS